MFCKNIGLRLFTFYQSWGDSLYHTFTFLQQVFQHFVCNITQCFALLSSFIIWQNSITHSLTVHTIKSFLIFYYCWSVSEIFILFSIIKVIQSLPVSELCDVFSYGVVSVKYVYIYVFSKFIAQGPFARSLDNVIHCRENFSERSSFL